MIFPRWRAQASGAWEDVNQEWAELTGQCLDEARQWGWLDCLHADDRENLRTAFAKGAGEGAGRSLKILGRVLDRVEGRYRWMEFRAVPRQTGGWFGAALDVDQFVTALNHLEVQRNEQRHQARNLLATIRAIFRRVLATSDGLDAVQSRFEDRLDAIARLQLVLSGGEAASPTLADLMAAEGAAIEGVAAGRLSYDGPAISLPRRTYEIVAMALHELLTNALKHGALGQPGGSVRVFWVHAKRTLVVNWREYCPQGLAEPAPSRRGYGRELIERALPYDLGADIFYEFDKSGLSCRMTIPIGADDD
ncbi:HWE histidine kinase domain-containing protein [Devosia nitrariae]|nr:HWE histidine kinase domain-containing protein [Devosia nitrariae]